MVDERYKVMKQRLSLLSKEELQRIVDNIDMLIFDTVNYDEKNHKFCPLAVAMQLDKTISNPTDSLIKSEIGKRFDPINVIKGIPGNFYRTQRENDLKNLCKEILCTK